MWKNLNLTEIKREKPTAAIISQIPLWLEQQSGSPVNLILNSDFHFFLLPIFQPCLTFSGKNLAILLKKPTHLLMGT